MNYLEKLTNIFDGKRGWVILPINDDDLLQGFVKNIHLASIQTNQIRGNHYHKYKTEFIYIFGGKVEIAIKNISTNNFEMRDVVDCDTPVLLIAKPNIAHTIKNISENTVYLFCYGTEAYDPNNPDVVSEVLIDQ